MGGKSFQKEAGQRCVQTHAKAERREWHPGRRGVGSRGISFPCSNYKTGENTQIYSLRISEPERKPAAGGERLLRRGPPRRGCSPASTRHEGEAPRVPRSGGTRGRCDRETGTVPSEPAGRSSMERGPTFAFPCSARGAGCKETTHTSGEDILRFSIC